MPPSYSSRISVLNMLGDALSHIGSLSEAENIFKEALKRAPNHVPAHLTMGQLRLKQNRTQEAYEWFLKALIIAPNSTVTHLHYGIFNVQMGDLQTAKESYLKVLELNPLHLEALHMLSTVCREMGDNQQAEQHLSRLVSLSPTAISHSNYGAILHLNGKHMEAELQYSESLRLNPNDTVTRHNMAKLRRLVSRKLNF